jgi:ribonucleoside-diphosphate reductase alpha chain
VDSAISKTINVGSHVSFQDFSRIYTRAWELGLKGVTTFRAAGKRFGILRKVEPEPKAEACYIDPATGSKECS